MALPPPSGGCSLRAPSYSSHLLLPTFSISVLQNPTKFRNPSFSRDWRCSAPFLRIKPPASARLSRILMNETEEAVGESFLEAIEELERMVRDPCDVLAEMTERLSARELQLVLVYFAQEGRDSYCALDVFEWLRRENRVDGEMMELMVSIACGWIERIIGGDHEVDDVLGLLNEMDCVGLEPGFSMLEKVVSLYWERGKKEEAVEFVKDVMRKGGVGAYSVKDGGGSERGGVVGYLAWKMMHVHAIKQAANSNYELPLLIIKQTGMENIENLISLGGMRFLTHMLEFVSLEEKSQAAVVVQCIKADECCRNQLAMNISTPSLVELTYRCLIRQYDPHNLRSCTTSLLCFPSLALIVASSHCTSLCHKAQDIWKNETKFLVMRKSILVIHEQKVLQSNSPAKVTCVLSFFLQIFSQVDENYIGAVKSVIEFKHIGLKPEVYSYLIALTALVKEQIEFSKSLRRLKGSLKAGKIDKLDSASTGLVNRYQSKLISYAVCLSEWAIHEGSSSISLVVYEKLLSIYACAGFGLEAERQIWQMKLLGKEPDRELYDAVLATCASQNEVTAVHRLLAGIGDRSAEHRKKSLSWLLRGYLKGGYYLDASETLIRMLNLGLCPEYIDRVAVLQGLRKIIQASGNIEPYIKLCRYLSDGNLIGPCLAYMYIERYKLWIGIRAVAGWNRTKTVQNANLNII
ncbi:Pentatricopeptide repeat-containing protein [Platanthera guangdongensis]|uniref:Pentatricopeptide repeat-containing protein n=1 Tax=Platanthera guangdongensis TaxID=2320717 RepID=A0ABR2N460_9ASPA